MDKKQRNLFVGVLVAIVVIVMGIRYVNSDGDGIVEGQEYGLAMTYKSVVEETGEDARVFDFSDRNLPRTSILVPMRDERGIPLVVENPEMTPSTVRKIRVQVPKRVVEDVVYPAYEYVRWEFRFSTREVQGHVPNVTPRR